MYAFSLHIGHWHSVGPNTSNAAVWLAYVFTLGIRPEYREGQIDV
jgi:hypothetical protein